MLLCLATRSDTGFELTLLCGYHKKSHVGLRCSSDHVLDEVLMTRCIDDRVIVFVSEELEESDVNG